MRGPRFASLIVLISYFGISCGPKTPARPDYAVTAVPLAQVDITDNFWAPKQEVNRTVSIQYCFMKSEESGRRGLPVQYYEGAGYMMAKKPDPAFDAFIKPKIEALSNGRRPPPPRPRPASAWPGGRAERPRKPPCRLFQRDRRPSPAGFFHQGCG